MYIYIHSCIRKYIYIHTFIKYQYPIGPPLIKVYIHTYIHTYKHTYTYMSSIGADESPPGDSITGGWGGEPTLTSGGVL